LEPQKLLAERWTINVELAFAELEVWRGFHIQTSLSLSLSLSLHTEIERDIEATFHFRMQSPAPWMA